MSSHHPPRPCFNTLAFSDASLDVFAVFTDRLIPYRFTAPSQPAHDDFRAHANGVFFNAAVRNIGTWDYVRLG